MLYKWIFFVLVWSYSVSSVCLPRTTKEALFSRFLRSLLITYLITLSLKQEIIVLEKSLEKVLNFESKITNPVNGSKDSAAIIEVSNESEKREISRDLLKWKTLIFSTTQVELAKRRQNFFELQRTFILVRKTKDRHLYFRQRIVSLNKT